MSSLATAAQSRHCGVNPAPIQCHGCDHHVSRNRADRRSHAHTQTIRIERFRDSRRAGRALAAHRARLLSYELGRRVCRYGLRRTSYGFPDTPASSPCQVGRANWDTTAIQCCKAHRQASRVFRKAYLPVSDLHPVICTGELQRVSVRVGHRWREHHLDIAET